MTDASPPELDAWQQLVEDASKLSVDPELVIAVVTPVGTNTGEFVARLVGALAEWNYSSDIIKLSDGFNSDDPGEGEHEDDRVSRLITAGNMWCENHKSSSGVAPLAVRMLRSARAVRNWKPGMEFRSDSSESQKVLLDRPVPRHAYILHSLKRPAEIKLLRWVYGENLIVLAAQAGLEERLETLTNRLRSHATWSEQARRRTAQKMIDQDARQTDRYGQNLSGTFTQGDMFVESTAQLTRQMNVLFGDSREAPTEAEFGMFAAFGSSARSLTASRRVGASIVKAGAVVAVGMNDVPRVSGLSPDAILGYDFSQQRKQELAGQILEYLAEEAGPAQQGWVSEDRRKQWRGDRDGFLRSAAESLKASPLSDIIEFQRAVHAEMWAIMDAVRIGIALADCQMYSTTYPCHLCWKHVFASDIKSLYYIDLYRKSQVENMYPHTRGMLRPFVGTAPHRFLSFFLERPLKEADLLGNISPPVRASASPRIDPTPEETISEREHSVMLLLEQSESSQEEAIPNDTSAPESSRVRTDGS